MIWRINRLKSSLLSASPTVPSCPRFASGNSMWEGAPPPQLPSLILPKSEGYFSNHLEFMSVCGRKGRERRTPKEDHHHDHTDFSGTTSF